jgi:hypothetical protein
MLDRFVGQNAMLASSVADGEPFCRAGGQTAEWQTHFTVSARWACQRRLPATHTTAMCTLMGPLPTSYLAQR